jgi:hypothetical protein
MAHMMVQHHLLMLSEPHNIVDVYAVRIRLLGVKDDYKIHNNSVFSGTKDWTFNTYKIHNN